MNSPWNKDQISSNSSISTPMSAQTQSVEVDQGLRSFMMRVYNYMASALIVTGLVAYFVSGAAVVEEAGQIVGLTSFGNTIFNSPLKWVIMFAPLAAVLFMSFKVQSLSASTAQLIFWGFAALMGLSLASIFLVFTGESIARTFFITAATFGVMSLWGYTTQRDLTGMGSFLMMGVIGLIIASVVNIFLGSTTLQFIVSALGVLIFTGLIAYDTQKLKRVYYEVTGCGEAMAKAAIMGALSLYLDFVNLFISLLQLIGDRR